MPSMHTANDPINVKIALVATLGIFLCLVSLLTDAVSAQSPRTSSSEVVTHEVVLGHMITVSIVTEVDESVKDAKFWVRPHGDDKIPSYSYVDFTQNGDLRATGEIDVRAPSYFPPGTIFDVWFEFALHDGARLSSATYIVEHLGDDHDWRRISGGLLEIVYYGIPASSIDSLHARVAARLPEISEALGVADNPQYRAVIFPNLRELTKHGPRISQAATDGIYFGGYAYDEYNLTIMSSPSDEVLIHELTHLIFDRKLDSPLATSAPGWLNEGNSSYWETGDRRDTSRDFRRFARTGDVTEFSKMDSVPGIRSDIHRFYVQSADFVGYLLENYGRDSVGKLLDELNAGSDVDEAMVETFGGNLVEIENEWRREWGLQPVGTETITEIEELIAMVPTIPGLPTIERGITQSMPVHTENRQPTAENPVVESEPTVIRIAELVTPQPQATVPTQPTTVSMTPKPYPTSIFFVPTAEGEWPGVKPSAVIVFLLLGLGVAAMMYRRMRS